MPTLKQAGLENKIPDIVTKIEENPKVKCGMRILGCLTLPAGVALGMWRISDYCISKIPWYYAQNPDPITRFFMSIDDRVINIINMYAHVPTQGLEALMLYPEVERILHVLRVSGTAVLAAFGVYAAIKLFGWGTKRLRQAETKTESN